MVAVLVSLWDACTLDMKVAYDGRHGALDKNSKAIVDLSCRQKRCSLPPQQHRSYEYGMRDYEYTPDNTHAPCSCPVAFYRCHLCSLKQLNLLSYPVCVRVCDAMMTSRYIARKAPKFGEGSASSSSNRRRRRRASGSLSPG